MVGARCAADTTNASATTTRSRSRMQRDGCTDERSKRSSKRRFVEIESELESCRNGDTDDEVVGVVIEMRANRHGGGGR